MCNKVVNTHLPTINYVLECLERLKKCVINQIHMFFVFHSIPDQHKAQEICDIVVSLYTFLIV